MLGKLHLHPTISLQVGLRTLPTMLVELQYVVDLYWNPECGCICVSAARAVASLSQSISEFITSHGSVGPGRIMPVK